MVNREKVVEGLELCAKRFCDSDCPYYRRSPMIGGACITALLEDVLILLKEQGKRINELEEKLRML